MSMIFSGSKDYSDPMNMYYAQRDGKIIRLEIYAVNSTAQIVEMYEMSGYVVTKARDTDAEISERFTELHSFKNWPK